MEAQQQKLLRQQQLLAEQAQKTAMHQHMRDENASRVVQNKTVTVMNKRNEAQDTKYAKSMYREMHVNNKLQEEKRAQQIKGMIRAQQHEANVKRQQDFIEKQNRARA